MTWSPTLGPFLVFPWTRFIPAMPGTMPVTGCAAAWPEFPAAWLPREGLVPRAHWIPLPHSPVCPVAPASP
eukprot:2666306-Alexandrium_andersonii.AAC.1